MFSSLKISSFSIFALMTSQTVMANESANKASSQLQLHQPSYVFNQQQIENSGVSNVYSLLNFLPGFQSVIAENQSTHMQTQVRGMSAESGMIVVMIDNVKVNSLLSKDVQMLMPHFDLTLVEKVEVYRAADAIKFGNNAGSAVINIVTKKSNFISLEAGSHHHNRASVGLNKQTDFGTFSLSLSRNEGDGADYNEQNIPVSSYSNTENHINKPYLHKQLNAKWQVGQFLINYYQDQHLQDGFLNQQSYNPDNQFTVKNQFLTTQYHHEYSNKLSFNTDLTYAQNKMESVALIEKGGTRPFSEDYWYGPNWAATNVAFNLTADYKYSDALNFEFGGQWQQQEQDKAGLVTSHLTSDKQNSLPLDRYYLGEIQTVADFKPFNNLLQTVESHGLFTNSYWKITELDQISGGVRLERIHGYSDIVLVQLQYQRQINEKSLASARYYQGFRAPTFNELFFDGPFEQGNKNLDVETIDTFELNYQFTEQKWHAGVTAFYQKYNDAIALNSANGQDFIYANIGNKDIAGIEGNSEYQLNANWKLTASLTHYLNQTVNNAFKSFAAVGVNGTVDNASFGLNTIIRSAESDKSVGFKQDAHAIVNAVVNYNFGRSISLSLKVENAFNDKQNVYDVSQVANQYYVAQQRRFVSLTLGYQF